MSREIPAVIRAVAGLTATVLDEARRLPRTLPALPVRVLGLAMQAAMRLQQQYAGLVARGDELFTGLRGADEPGLATFDEDEEARATGGRRSSAFDRAAATVPDEQVAEEVAGLIDDEVSGLPPEPAPEEVVEALQDITDQVQAAEGPPAGTRPGKGTPAGTRPGKGTPAGTRPGKGTPAGTRPGKGTRAGTRPGKGAAAGPPAGHGGEDDLERAMLEADGAPDTALVDGGTADAGLVDAELIAEAPAPSDPGGSPVGERAGGPDVGAGAADAGTPGTDVATTDGALPASAPADVSNEVDVLTPEGEVATVQATVTDEGVAAPETGEEAAPAGDGGAATDGAAVATDEGGGPVAAATGVRVDVGRSDTAAEDAAIAEGAAVDAVGETSGETGVAPTDDAGGGSELSGSQAAGAAPVEGYDSFSIAQLRGRLRGYQPVTVRDLLAYEEATRAREPYLRMLRNRLERLERQESEDT